LARDGDGHRIGLDDAGLDGKIGDEAEFEELRFISVVPCWLSPLLVLGDVFLYHWRWLVPSF
jgi:hypothetical protein